MKKNKILSLLMAMVMVCTLLIGTQRNVQAADGQEMCGWIIFDKR